MSWLSNLRGFGLRAYNNINKRSARAVLPYLVKSHAKPLRFGPVGDGEGAWIIPVDVIQADWVAYCVGVGTNATFDQALSQNFGLRVTSIDPTPIAIDYMAALDRDPTRHAFLPIGIWNRDTTLRLYAPMGVSSVNLSARDIHATGRFVEVPCKTLRTVMAEQGHDRIDLLKIDIEGSWFEVIEDMCRTGVQVSVLCAEFDSPTSLPKALKAIRLLDEVGLVLVNVQRDNLVFVQRAFAS